MKMRSLLAWIATALPVIAIAAPVAVANATSHPSSRTLLVVALIPVVGIVLGAIARDLTSVVANVVVTVLFMIALPGLMPACCGGDESAIIGTLRAINSSQQAYASACSGVGKFASTLETLKLPPTSGGAAFISSDVSEGRRRGYQLTLIVPEGETVEACNGRQVVVPSYFIEAHLIEPLEGRRNFATDESGVVYENRDGKIIEPGMTGAQPIQ
jgi:hypothetical protein